MTTESVDIKGFVTVEMFENNQLIQTLEVRNLLVRSGKDLFANMIFGTFTGVDESEVPFIRDISIGSGTTAPVVANTDMQSELARLPFIQKNINQNILTYFTTFGEGVGTGSVNEVGLFTNEGVLVCRTILSNTFDKTANRFINISWRLQIG